MSTQMQLSMDDSLMIDESGVSRGAVSEDFHVDSPQTTDEVAFHSGSHSNSNTSHAQEEPAFASTTVTNTHLEEVDAVHTEIIPQNGALVEVSAPPEPSPVPTPAARQTNVRSHGPSTETVISTPPNIVTRARTAVPSPSMQTHHDHAIHTESNNDVDDNCDNSVDSFSQTHLTVASLRASIQADADAKGGKGRKRGKGAKNAKEDKRATATDSTSTQTQSKGSTRTKKRVSNDLQHLIFR